MIKEEESIPDEVDEWLKELARLFMNSNQSTQVKTEVLESEGFEVPVARHFLANNGNAPCAPNLLTLDPETVVLILETGYIIVELADKSYKYRIKNKIEKKLSSTYYNLDEDGDAPISKEVEGKENIKNNRRIR